jgi:signal transduction histidine kinase
LPGLRDLNPLFISYREFGYAVNYRETGPALELDDGMSLVIYRVVYDCLDNIKKHAPINTGVDVDFIWKDTALQILVKDNGEEVRRELNSEPNEYTVSEDQKALVEHLTGPGLTAMAERVALFEGTIEFTRVPGVGFTVSAAFPNVAKYSKGN